MKTKPKILFLDDRTERTRAAYEKYSQEYDLYPCSNVKECLRLLCREDFKIASLDHDLDGCDFEDPDSSNAGMEVVRYLEKTGWPTGKKKPYFIVHSSNIFAAHLMVTRLQALGLAAEWKRFEYPAKSFTGPASDAPVTQNNGA